MNFRTLVSIAPSPDRILHNSRLLMLGSCFAENMGERLINAGFTVDLNPFGILYNPLSIEQALTQLLDDKRYRANELVEYEGLWHSMMHHSRFSASSKDECLKKINDRIALSVENFKKADFLFITFGTAWIYELVNTGAVAANCHKLPERYFSRRRLTVEEIVEKYTKLVEKLLKTNPQLRIIFTVSPIRHWKDGAHGNNLSKATLLLAIEQITQQFDNASYFPAYELVLDELRDYRFYTDDMQHPSAVAVNYIWQRLGETFFSEETKKLAAENEKQARIAAHKPIVKI
ncbi:MAG: GSCFA domain-containing protein [Prevotellaceae bacterium]|jgi:hypothetical protein|nr:GSCFA domain-containing protein [Prevotellaceae bacterium]